MPKHFHILDSESPLSDADVLHIMGCWDKKAARLAGKARKMGIPYLVCALGGISPWNMSVPKLKRAWQRMSYVKTMLSQADAILTFTQMEFDYHVKLKWNKHIFRIPNALFTRQITLQEMSENTAKVYEKLMADHEEKTAKLIADKLAKSRAKEKHPHDEAEIEAETKVVSQIMLIHLRMAHKNIPADYVTTLHHLLNDTEYSDDIVAEMLKKQKLYGYSRSLFATMNRKTHLTEGFMPMPAKDDRLAKEIEKYIK